MLREKTTTFVVTYFQADWCTQTARNYVEPVNLIRTSDFQTVVASFVYSLHQMASERTVGSWGIVYSHITIQFHFFLFLIFQDVLFSRSVINSWMFSASQFQGAVWGCWVQNQQYSVVYSFPTRFKSPLHLQILLRVTASQQIDKTVFFFFKV